MIVCFNVETKRSALSVQSKIKPGWRLSLAVELLYLNLQIYAVTLNSILQTTEHS